MMVGAAPDAAGKQGRLGLDLRGRGGRQAEWVRVAGGARPVLGRFMAS